MIGEGKGDTEGSRRGRRTGRISFPLPHYLRYGSCFFLRRGRTRFNRGRARGCALIKLYAHAAPRRASTCRRKGEDARGGGRQKERKEETETETETETERERERERFYRARVRGRSASCQRAGANPRFRGFFLPRRAREGGWGREGERLIARLSN